MLLLQLLRMSFLKIWLSWKQKAIEIIASFAAENMEKEGVFSCREVKNCYIA